MPEATTTTSAAQVQQLKATLTNPPPQSEDADSREARLKDQEAALLKLGSVYRDQKLVQVDYIDNHIH